MRGAAGACYDGAMDAALQIVGGLARALGERFGPALTVVRDGSRVRWSFGTAAAAVALVPPGRLEATFLDASGRDALSAEAVESRYRRVPHTSYGLTPAGCRRFANDLIDFFNGVREPRFEFVGIAGQTKM
jgi:hypothetical protein